MTNNVSAIGLLWALGVLAFGSIAQAQQQSHELEILRLELVTHLDANIERGPFDTTAPVDRRLVRDVRNCVEAVRKASMDWAVKEKLVISLEDRRESLLVLHFEPPMQRGIYEISYRVDITRGYATGAFKYFDPTGSILSSPTSAYREFSSQLRKAMLCD